MADFLKTFIEGEDILASDANSNNQFLLSKLSDNAAQVQNYVEGEVAAMKSNIASVQAALQSNIDELTNGVGKSVSYIIESYVNGDSGYEVWSNGKIVQWGRQYHSGGKHDYTIYFLKPYSTKNYVVTGSWSARPIVGDKGLMWGCSERETTYMRLFADTNSSNSQACNIYWRTEGY